MDIPADVLEVLKCSRCELYLSRGPVYLQHDGAAACGRCYTPERPAFRNTQYEAAARILKLKFPCKYQELGCLETVSYVERIEVIVHEDDCEHRQYARRACENHSQGCTHTDFGDKCSKHEYFFCQQSTKCYICKVSVSRGSLSAHYAFVHQDISHRAGSTWRVTWGLWRRHLVSSVAGTAVCEFLLLGFGFVLCVYIPMTSERLSEFHCEVRVTDPVTGHARTFTCAVDYNVVYDWRIEVNKNKFPWLNTELDVCVLIRKAES